MAAPLNSDKQAVDLAAAGSVRGSRIRREPVPVEKELALADVEGRDARTVIFGVITFSIAIVVASLGLMAAGGYSVKDQVVHLDARATGS